MKKLYKIALIGFVPLIIGLALLFIGGYVHNETLAYAGKMILSIGFPVTLFILVVVGIILAITGKLSDNQNSGRADVTGAPDEAYADGQTAAEKERQAIEGINSSYGYASEFRETEYQIEHVAQNYKNASRGDKIKSWLLFGFLIIDFALIIVLGYMGIMVGALICGGIFAGTILICIITVVILQKVSQSSKINPKKYDYKTATVKVCLLSSMAETGGTHTVRVHSVTYRIMLEVDGKQYRAYSKNVYEVGEQVKVAVKKNYKGVAKIIEQSADEKIAQLEERLNKFGEDLEQFGKELDEAGIEREKKMKQLDAEKREFDNKQNAIPPEEKEDK